MRVVDEPRRRQRAAPRRRRGRCARDDVVLRRADSVGVARHLAQPLRRRHLLVGARVAADDAVVRPRRLRAEQLHDRHLQLAVELLEVADLERLHEHRSAALVEAVALQRPHERLLERQPDAAEVRRVLRLRVDADLAAQPLREPLAQVEHLLQRRDLVEPVVRRGVARPDRGDPLLGAQRLELRKREVLDEEALERRAVDRLLGPPVGELLVLRDIGRVLDLGLVARDEHAVLRDRQVGLDVVGAQARGEPVGGERVLRPVAGRAAVPDHELLRAVAVGLGTRFGGCGHHREHDDQQRKGEKASACCHAPHETPCGPIGVNES